MKEKRVVIIYELILAVKLMNVIVAPKLLQKVYTDEIGRNTN